MDKKNKELITENIFLKKELKSIENKYKDSLQDLLRHKNKFSIEKDKIIFFIDSTLKEIENIRTCLNMFKEKIQDKYNTGGDKDNNKIEDNHKPLKKKRKRRVFIEKNI